MPHASLFETATFDASHSLSPGIVDNAVCAFDSLPVIAVSTSPHSVRDQVRQSFYSGMCWHGGLTGLYPSVAQYPNAVRAFTRLVRAVSPRHVFSSIVVLDGSEMGIRDDAQNACLPALVIPMTRFSGGQLAIASPHGQVITHSDQSFRARLCSLEQGPIAIDAPGLKHAVMPSQGRRLVLIAFCLQNVTHLDKQSARTLRELGFNLPDAEPPIRAVPAFAKGFPDLGPLGFSSSRSRGEPAVPSFPSCPEALPAVRPQRLMFVELCCGSAGLSFAFRSLGFQVLAIDRASNRHRPLVHCVHLDLRLDSSWTYLTRLVQARQVLLVHVAPREVPWQGRHASQCLRSEASPDGLPGLPPAWQSKVDSANAVYRRTSAFCMWLCEQRSQNPEFMTHFCVENPASSYMWLLPDFVALRSKCFEVSYDSCMHGGDQAKRQVLWTSMRELGTLARQCDNSHTHRQSPTAEAEYPEACCSRYAAAAALALGASHTMPASPCISNESARAAAHRQPRTSRAIVLVDEYQYQVTVPLPSGQVPSLDDKNCLCCGLGPVPAGSKVLGINFEGGVVFPKRPRPDRNVTDQLTDFGEGRAASVTCGVCRNPWQFATLSLSLMHPFDMFSALPDQALTVIARVLIDGPLVVVRHRLNMFVKWKRWGKELVEQEEKSHTLSDKCPQGTTAAEISQRKHKTA